MLSTLHMHKSWTTKDFWTQIPGQTSSGILKSMADDGDLLIMKLVVLAVFAENTLANRIQSHAFGSFYKGSIHSLCNPIPLWSSFNYEVTSNIF